MKKFLSAIILTLVLALTAIPVFAADNAEEEHTYKVTVYAGAQGTVNGGSSASIEAKFGEEINLNNYFSVSLNNNSKYYVMGFRKSGLDNSTVSAPVFDITEDTDFVVAYGINGAPVEYTARFVEYGTNRQLEDSVTYTGKAGDKPIIAYLYIDGYRPRYRNITKTLSSNPDENVFTFEYIPLTVEEPTTQPTTQPTTTAAPQQTTTAAPANQGGGDQNQPAGGGNTPAAGTDNTPAAGTDNTPGGTTDNPGGTTDNQGGTTDNPGGTAEQETEPVNPQDIQTEDLGDLDVPLAGPGTGGDETSTGGIETQTSQPTQATQSSSPSTWIYIVIIVAVLLILFLIWWFLIRGKKKSEDK